MFGIKFIKVEPTTYLIKYKKGKIKKEGPGLSFYYFRPTTSLIAISLASVDVPFIFNEVTSDFQEVTVQGQVSYRIEQPKKIAELLNFTLSDKDTSAYETEDPEKLSQRIINETQVLLRAELQKKDLRSTLTSSDDFVKKVIKSLADSESLAQLGVSIVNFSILAIKPNPETARALEAEAREQLLRTADEAIYDRRNSAVEQERAIKENELNTEIAVENKKREIRETKIEAERVIQEKKRVIDQEDLQGKISLEEKKKKFVELSVKNRKAEADAREYEIAASVKAIREVDPKIVQSLASAGMQPEQLIAEAFKNIAESSDKIGSLNITPDLLRELLSRKTKK